MAIHGTNIHVSAQTLFIHVHMTCWRQTPRWPTPKQYRILVIRGGMKTLAVRRDFDCCFLGFRVLIWGLGFQAFRLLGFSVCWVFRFKGLQGNKKR